MDFYACLLEDYKVTVKHTLSETSQQKISKSETLFCLMDSWLSFETSLKSLESSEPIIFLKVLKYRKERKFYWDLKLQSQVFQPNVLPLSPHEHDKLAKV